MDVAVSTLLSARLLLSVAASAWQKRLLRGAVDVGTLWGTAYLGLAGPAVVLLAAGWPGGVGGSFWVAAAAAGGMDALGNRASGMALARSDLSVHGPLNALRPALAAFLGALLLGEYPGWLGGAGIVVTVGGTAWLWSPARPGPPGAAGWVMGWRVAGLGLSVGAAALLKQAVTGGGVAATLAVWVLAGWGALGVLWVLGMMAGWSSRGRSTLFRERRSGRGWWAELAGHGAVLGAMQAATLAVLGAVPLASAFVFFQLAMVLQVLVGRMLFGERETARRLVACGVLCAGAAMVVADGAP
ncbi:MAG: hypothetical protein ACKO3N_15760 [Verrucomicrobiota bacterium]